MWAMSAPLPSYFYPRSPCGERPGNGGKIIGGANISIHALLAESDRQRRPKPVRNPPFLSTLSLRRATRPVQAATLLPRKFLSTLSLRRATQAIPRFFLASIHFYPRSPCGERPMDYPVTGVLFDISIHALLAESDLQYDRGNQELNNFYPRSPCGERPPLADGAQADATISIHALLAESDSSCCLWLENRQYFYPRSPCGERLRKTQRPYVKDSFLSTLSLRRATTVIKPTAQLEIISIHALLAESDRLPTFRGSGRLHFYPRSPCGERPVEKMLTRTIKYFYPRSPCGERHLPKAESVLSGSISIHALLAESAWTAQRPAYQRRISIHALLAESDRRAGEAHL